LGQPIARANGAERRVQIGGAFNTEACGAAEAMKAMRQGLRDSR
jgi:hypothetical protein